MLVLDGMLVLGAVKGGHLDLSLQPKHLGQHSRVSRVDGHTDQVSNNVDEEENPNRLSGQGLLSSIQVKYLYIT